MARYIDADEALKAITEYAKFLWVTYHESCNLAGQINAIMDVPTADVAERKRGEWIDKEIIEDRKDSKIQEWQQARCSVCNKWHTTPYMYYFDNYNYCPNCGADMRKPMIIPKEIIDSVLGYDD